MFNFILVSLFVFLILGLGLLLGLGSVIGLRFMLQRIPTDHSERGLSSIGTDDVIIDESRSEVLSNAVH